MRLIDSAGFYLMENINSLHSTKIHEQLSSCNKIFHRALPRTSIFHQHILFIHRNFFLFVLQQSASIHQHSRATINDLFLFLSKCLATICKQSSSTKRHPWFAQHQYSWSLFNITSIHKQPQERRRGIWEGYPTACLFLIHEYKYIRKKERYLGRISNPLFISYSWV